jgi:D-alanyl-D-alanine carboxypeptidase (penicillin-binding protein 5/6)
MNGIKKIFALVLAMLYIIPMFVVSNGASESNSSLGSDFHTENAYILYSSSDARVLAGENTDKKLPPASLTKMMVMLIAAEAINGGAVKLTDEVRVSDAAAARDGSVIWLTVGERLSLSELLKSITISSANDSAYAVSEYLSEKSGNAATETAFVEQMNARAVSLGMTSTHYTNCVGYDDPDHYSTAKDTAVLLSELLKHKKIYGEWWLTRLDYVREGTDKKAELLNTNKLLKYKGLIGGKTGTTDGAGYCLAAGAERDGLTLVSVVLGATDDTTRTSRSKQILDYGFANYSFKEVSFSELPKTVKVKGGIKVEVSAQIVDPPKCVSKNGSGAIKVSYEIPSHINAPITKGDTIGKATGKLGDTVVFTADITAKETVEKYTFARAFGYIIDSVF